MKKIILIFLIKIFFFSLTSQSFAWDTTAAKFYPLAIGNSYTYVKQQLHDLGCLPMQIYGNYRVKITRDTILNNGKKYFVFEGWNNILSTPNWRYQRIDSSTMNVYFFDETVSLDRLMDSLKAQLGDTFKCNRFTTTHWAWAKFQNQNTGFIYGQNRIFRNYPARASAPTQLLEYNLVEGIGFRSFSMCELGGVTYYTKGAVINGIVYGDTSLTHVQQIGSAVPDKFELMQNYPNPFNPSTNFEFRIADFGFVKLKIFDMLGKELETLVNENLNLGIYQVQWNAKNFPSGVYFYRLETNDFKDVKRMVILK
ncbi:MAG TPA: T9SS type A sorting domain-containing protein [Ignavibacteria bacterium]|nr:T9SS type A sorting domain-containing protein [Ignavibacteria bacterium]